MLQGKKSYIAAFGFALLGALFLFPSVSYGFS